MLKYLNEHMWQYFWCIVETFGIFWNKYNEYGVPKKTLRQCNQCFSLQKWLFKRCEMISN